VESVEFLGEDLAVLTEPGRIAGHFEQEGTKVVDDDPPFGANLAGRLAGNQRGPGPGPARLGHVLADDGENANDQVERLGVKVFDHRQVGDKAVERGTDGGGIMAANPPGQVGQRDRAVGLAEGVQDRVGGLVLQVTGHPTRPPVAEHVA